MDNCKRWSLMHGGHKNTIEISANEIRKTIVNIQNELGRW
jgi:hypothetical protein